MLTTLTHFFKLSRNANPGVIRTIYAGLDHPISPARVSRAPNKNALVLKSNFPSASVRLADEISEPYKQNVLHIKNGVIEPEVQGEFHPHEFYKIIPPALLYSIPQPIWEDFIRGLNQDVVAVLDLKTHRHLWMAYNYALETSIEEIALKRAQLIAKHHFALAILYHDNLLNILSTSRIYKRQALEELRDNCTEFQRILREENFFNYILAEKIHPVFTPKFLHKMAHLPNVFKVVGLAEAILRYSATTIVFPCSTGDISSTEPVKFDPKKMQNAINWLPSSTQKPKELSDCVTFFEPLEFSNKASLFPSRQSWSGKENITKAANYEIFDYKQALFNDLIYREVLQKIHEECINEKTDFIIAKVNYKFRQLIAASNDILRLNALQKRWRKNIHVIKDKKPLFSKEAREWKSLMETTVIDGITITPLTSESALKSHGNEMDHCVGGYTEECLENTSNILKLIDAQNGKSTLELVYVKDKIKIQAHKGEYNSFPNERHRKAALELLRQINEGIIPLNEDRLNEKPIHSQVHTEYPYEVNELGIQEEIYQIYKTLGILPSILTADNYQEMLKKSGLDNLIGETITAENFYKHMTLRRA